MEEASKHVPTSDHSEDAAAMRKVHDTIVPLNDLARSSYTEIQRDAAAAFNSLSISDDSKPVFLTSYALRSVIHLAQSHDVEILNNIVEAVGRLCQHPLIKRPFMEVGVLKVLHKFSTSSKTMAAHTLFALMGLSCHDPTRADKNKYAHLKPDADDKLQMTTAENGHFVRFIFKCTLASTGANDRPDPKTRRYAIAALTSLLDGPANMTAMLRAGALERFMKLLRSRDSHMRIGAATALTSLMRLSPTASVSITFYEQMRQDKCLAAAFTALSEAVEIDLATALLNLVQAVITHAPDGMSKVKLRKRMMQLGCADILMSHAVRLLAIVELPVEEPRFSSANKVEHEISPKLILLRTVTATILELLQGQTALTSFVQLKKNHLRSVMKFVKSTDKRVCRHGSRLLGRLSTLLQAKQRILEDPSNMPQLLSLATGELLVDVSPTIARVLAELAEAWQNRVPLITGGVLTALSTLILTSWAPSTKFDSARCLADLAEAVDNREVIATTCLHVLAKLLKTEQSDAREQAMRCILNLVGVAGEVATVDSGKPLMAENAANPSSPVGATTTATPGRYGLTVGVEYGIASEEDEDEEEEDEEETKVEAQADNNEEGHGGYAQNHDQQQDLQQDLQQEDVNTLEQDSSQCNSSPENKEEMQDALSDQELPSSPDARPQSKSNMAPSQSSALLTERQSNQESCTAVWRQAIGAVAPHAFARLNDVAWWTTDEGKKFSAHHNDIVRGNIHMHILSDEEMMGQMMALMRNQHEAISQYATRVIQELAKTEEGTGLTARFGGTLASEKAAMQLVTRRRDEGRSVGFKRTPRRATFAE
jgi:hypothetical protein